MIRFSLDREKNKALQVLCLGCHSDDIEIGCGGTILRLRREYANCEFHWVVFSATGDREAEARLGAERFAGQASLRTLRLENFRDGFMPFVGADIKSVFEDVKQRVSPDLILTHFQRDAHQDHRLIAELTWNTFRDQLILKYEIPKYDGDMGQPNLFVSLDADEVERKVDYVMEVFESQHSRQWFDRRTFLALLRLRGMECNASSGYAEGFHCRKLVL